MPSAFARRASARARRRPDRWRRIAAPTHASAGAKPRQRARTRPMRASRHRRLRTGSLENKGNPLNPRAKPDAGRGRRGRRHARSHVRENRRAAVWLLPDPSARWNDKDDKNCKNANALPYKPAPTGNDGIAWHYACFATSSRRKTSPCAHWRAGSAFESFHMNEYVRRSCIPLRAEYSFEAASASHDDASKCQGVQGR